MTWSIQWFLRSPRKITDAEREALVAFVKQQEAKPWQIGRFIAAVLGGSGLVAGGTTAMPEDVTHPDWPLLLDALTRFRGVVPDLTCEVKDDLALVAWNETTARYETRGWERSEAPAAPAPPPRDESEDERNVREAYGRVLAAGNQAYEVRKQLDGLPTEVVIRIGLEMLPTIPPQDHRTGAPGGGDVARAICDAFERLRDVPVVEPAIIAAWDARPSDTELSRLLATAFEKIAAHPLILGRAARALMSPATEQPQRSMAVSLLGAARSAGTDAAPILVARAREDRAARSAAPWRADLLSALERLRRPEGFATLLLEGHDDLGAVWRVMSAIATCAPARALPFLLRMRDVSDLSKESLVRAISQVPGDGATEALIGFGEFPITEVRALAADALVARGRLAEAAAIWKTIDAVGYENYMRRSALRAFGISDEKAKVDWDELVRARGLAVVTVAPVLRPSQVLVHADGYVRAQARRALEKIVDQGYFVAFARAAQLEAELRRIGQPWGTVSWYAWRDALAKLGCTTNRDEELIAWIVEHAADLPGQVSSPELDAIATRGAAAVAAELVRPPFRLTAEELAALDKEEAAIAANASLPELDSSSPPQAPGFDIFDGPHPETQGATLPDDDIGLAAKPGYLTPSWYARDGVIDVLDGHAVGEIRNWDDLHVGLWFAAVVRRRTRWLRFDAFELTLRDRERRPLHSVVRREEKLIGRSARIGLDGHLSRAAYREAHTAEARGIVREPFQVRAGAWQLGRFDETVPGQVPVVAIEDPVVPQLPGLTSPVRAIATCFVALIRDSMEIDVSVELGMSEPVFAVSPVVVAIVFRDARGSLLDRTRFDLVLPADGSTVIERRLFGMRVAKPDGSLEILVRGARTLSLPLATFALDGSVSR